ncbi:MAG: aspartate carbamoyltransferase regulatory subunit [Bifidobacteriaceae bacterium]|nr:aspartate carbamoyltransferase regulatory subunit [Bifidobacteriaceae bacterium]MCI1979307.1 aspartate carbamoyltransferase regulatory subunit [Bifidobacteriaceae bacterium]
MEVTSISEGIIIDHVPAGTALKVLNYLRIDPTTASIALIMNTTSNRYGSKDIIKIQNAPDVDLDVLGLIAPNATVDIVKDSRIVAKKRPRLPQKVTNVLSCVNPRCVTSTEHGIDQIFRLTNPETGEYRCLYCDEAAEL